MKINGMCRADWRKRERGNADMNLRRKKINAQPKGGGESMPCLRRTVISPRKKEKEKKAALHLSPAALREATDTFQALLYKKHSLLQSTSLQRRHHV